MRLRKSFSLGPFHATVSKSGISYSFGSKNNRITRTASGKIRVKFTIPGTRISYTSGRGFYRKRKKRR